jgi:hypothetical protein
MGSEAAGTRENLEIATIRRAGRERCGRPADGG